MESFVSAYPLDTSRLADRPDLAAQIGIIAALWSQIEFELGRLLGILLGTNIRLGLSMFFAIVSTTARIDAMMAVAAKRLRQDKLREFEAILRKARSIARERNRIVHSKWGISERHPNALVSVATEDHIQFVAVDVREMDENQILKEYEVVVFDKLRPMLYTMTDFS